MSNDKLRDLHTILCEKLLEKINDPDAKKIPCHRVVRSDLTLSENYLFGGKLAQKRKLEEEGIIFNKEKIILK